MTTKIKKSFFVLIFTICGIACQTQKEAETIRYTDFVNPIVRYRFSWTHLPGATLPGGMVQLSPDTPGPKAGTGVQVSLQR